MDKREEAFEGTDSAVKEVTVEADSELRGEKEDPLDFNVIFGNGKRQATGLTTALYLIGAFAVIGLLMYAPVNDMLVVALAAVVVVFFFGKLFLHVRGKK